MGERFQISYAEDMAVFRNLWLKVWLAVLVLSIVVCPFILSPYQLSILNEMGIATIGAIGLNVLTGYTGQISLGHGAFVAIGAYSSALLTGKAGVPFVLSVPLAGLMATLLGLVVGIPSLRLRGLYLALGTLAFGFIVEYVIFHWDLTQGDMGMPVESMRFGEFEIRSQRQHFYVIAAFAALAVISAKNIVRTKIGRCFVAIRDRDIAAEAMGIPIAKYKVMAFGIGSFYAGVAGSLVAHYQKWIVPGSFDLSLSIAYIAMIILGGLGTIVGSVFGAIFITGIPHGIVYLTDLFKENFPALSGLIVDLKLGIFGLIIVATLLFEPGGLFGVYRRVKTYWKTWPFKY